MSNSFSRVTSFHFGRSRKLGERGAQAHQSGDTQNSEIAIPEHSLYYPPRLPHTTDSTTCSDLTPAGAFLPGGKDSDRICQALGDRQDKLSYARNRLRCTVQPVCAHPFV